MTLSDATSLGPSGPGIDGNEGVLHVPQSSRITGTSLSGCLVTYPRYSLGGGLTPLQRCSQCILLLPPTDCASTLGQSGLGSNDIERVLNIPKSFRTGTPPLNAVQCSIQDTC